MEEVKYCQRMKCISAKFILFTILIIMQSCIKDDNSDCKESALRLRFRYTLNNQYSDLFGSEVRQVAVYVFDADGKYVGRYSDSGDKLASNYIMTIPLPEGDYRAVVICDNLNTFSAGWIDNRTNSFNSEFQQGVTATSDFRVMLNTKEGEEGYLVPVSVPGEFYTGYAADASSTYDTSYITDVDLMKDTKNIIVKISGINFLSRAVVVPDVFITAVNGRYKNDNTIDTSHKMLKYTPYNTSVTGNVMNCYLKTMRLVKGNTPMLVIKKPSESGYLFNRDITELILSTPKYTSQEDIDREDTFVFELNFSQVDNNIVISIFINGWKINTVTPVNE